MCWGCGGGGVWPCLAEMSWLGWKHWVPQPRGSLAGTKCERAQPDPVWVTSPIYTSWFHGSFQKSSPNHSRPWRSCTTGWRKGLLMWMIWIKLGIVVFVLLKHQISAFLSWIWIISSAPPWTRSREQIWAEKHNFLPYLQHSCLGAATIPSCPAALASPFFTSQNVWKAEVEAERSMERAKIWVVIFVVFFEILASFSCGKALSWRASLARITFNLWFVPYWAGLIKAQQKDEFTIINTLISGPNKTSREWEGDPYLTFSGGFSVTGSCWLFDRSHQQASLEVSI